MSFVFVIDTDKHPLNPIHPGRARILLTQGKAAVWKRFPFTLILKTTVEAPHLEPLRLKIDPGSKETGLVLVNDATGQVVFAAELTHRGEQIGQAKGTQDITVFLAKKPEVLTKILAQAKRPLKDAAAVNSSRWALYHRLVGLGLPVECGSGGLTKFNRTTKGLPKTHWLDASCVGKSTPQTLEIKGVIPLLITATGHGSRQMCLMDRFGFPRSKPKANKVVKGFQTGEIVRAVVPSGKKVGVYVGRVAVRASGSFNITTKEGVVQGVSHRYCTSLHHCDGYHYQSGGRHSSLA